MKLLHLNHLNHLPLCHSYIIEICPVSLYVFSLVLLDERFQDVLFCRQRNVSDTEWHL